MFTSAYETSLRATAQAVGMPRDWLYNVIKLESGWRANAYNKSGATGLIQFMPRTMKDFGLISLSVAARIPKDGDVPEAVKAACKADFLAKYPDAESQLDGPVRQYFARYRPYPTEESVYLSVLYPAWKNKPLSTPLPANVQMQNPGVKTLQDYVNLVRGHNKGPGAATLSLVAVSAIGLGAYFLLRS